MVDENKLKFISQVAIYEKKEKYSLYEVNKYFKKDYISKKMLQMFFVFTVSYVLVSLMFFLYNVQILLENVVIFDINHIIKMTIIVYILLLISFELITIIFAYINYDRMKEKEYIYLDKLKRLSKRYEFFNRHKELAKEDIDA